MYSALDVDIKPGQGFGIFEIGTSLWTLLDALRRNQNLYPQIEVKFDPDASATTPVIVHIRPHIDLLFSGRQQRLHTVCIRQLRDQSPPLTVQYNGGVLSSSSEVLRRVGVSKMFGPTYPGDELKYPGIWFSFEEDGIGEGLNAGRTGDKMQEVKRIIIMQHERDGTIPAVDALDEVHETDAMTGELAKVTVKIHDGVTLYFYPTATSASFHVRIGETSAQDLQLELGHPPRIHYKEDERMKIHAAVRTVDAEDGTGYFYNYFQHGIDFLLSERTHRVRKIILHTNIPGSPLFQRYKRCAWEIEDKPEDDEDDTPPRKRFFDRFETISHFLGHREPPPSMILDRTDEEENLTLSNPKTRLHGYDGIVLEVSESSQVVSLTMF